jgi:hypothetical protein
MFCARRPQDTHLMRMSARGRLGGVGVLPNSSPLFVLRKWLHVHEPVGDCFCSEGELEFAVILTLNPAFWHHTRDILACLSCALHPPSSRGAESIRTEVQSGDLIDEDKAFRVNLWLLLGTL